MKAINDRVIIRVGYVPESSGGIVLAQTTIDNGRLAFNVGKVIAAGPGVTLRTGEFIPVCVKKDDIVVWEQFGAVRFEVIGPGIVCVRAEDIGGILDEEEWKGKYLFEPDEIEAHQKRLEDERQAYLQKLRQEQAEMASLSVFKCMNKKCYNIGKEHRLEPGEHNCPDCNEPMVLQEVKSSPIILIK